MQLQVRSTVFLRAAAGRRGPRDGALEELERARRRPQVAPTICEK